MPEDSVGTLRDVHRKHVVAAGEVGEIAREPASADDVFRRSRSDHEIGERLQVILIDDVLDKAA